MISNLSNILLSKKTILKVVESLQGMIELIKLTSIANVSIKPITTTYIDNI